MPIISKPKSGVNRRPPFTSQCLQRCIFLFGFAYCLLVIFRFGSTSSSTIDISALAGKSSDSACNKCKDDFDLARNESNGFFADIPSDSWERAKSIANKMQPNYNGNPYSDESAESWFQNHFEPEFSCPFEVRIGIKGDGGKWVCDPHRIAPKGKDCLVYSVGSRGDASFEMDALNQISPDCQIHVFDFGNYELEVKKHTKNSPNVHYHRWGISDKTKTTRDGKFKTLLETVELLGHVNRTIDIFKIDCEWCEYDTYQHWLDAPVTLQQILLEAHGSGITKLKMPQTPQMFEALHEYGYVITHKEPNIIWAAGRCVEYVFLLLSPEFWKESKRQT